MRNGKFLIERKWLYYTLNFTWGILTNILGALVALLLLACGRKPKWYKGCVLFEVFSNWGGFSLGIFAVRDRTSSEHVSKHEVGHSYQNAWFGPFMILFVDIPSAMRYWYRRLVKTNKPYDLIWFEGSASDVGYLVN